MVSYGVALRAERREKQMTMREVAAAAGVDFPWLSKIENERLAPPPRGDDVHRRLAMALTLGEPEAQRPLEKRLRKLATKPWVASEPPSYSGLTFASGPRGEDWWEERLAEWNEMSVRS